MGTIIISTLIEIIFYISLSLGFISDLDDGRIENGVLIISADDCWILFIIYLVILAISLIRYFVFYCFGPNYLFMTLLQEN